MRLARQGKAFVAAVAILAAALLISRMAAGEEPKCRCELRVEFQGNGVPLLAKIPYLSKLFTSNGASSKSPCDAERIGIDFETIEGQVVEFHGPLCLGVGDCQVCPLPAKQALAIACGKVETCGSDCPAGKCCAGAKCCAEAGACATKCCATTAQQVTCEKGELWEHLAELTAENSALQATLEGHEAILETKGEMYESLAELMVEKAKLEARLEMVEHRDALLKEMVELQAENAKLKAQAELAVQKEELLKTQLATLLENERLKQRVAELEQAHGGESPVLAEKKQLKAKKVR